MLGVQEVERLAGRGGDPQLGMAGLRRCGGVVSYAHLPCRQLWAKLCLEAWERHLNGMFATLRHTETIIYGKFTRVVTCLTTWGLLIHCRAPINMQF